MSKRVKRCLLGSAVFILVLTAALTWPRSSVSVVSKFHDDQQEWSIQITNALRSAISFLVLPIETRSETGWGETEIDPARWIDLRTGRLQNHKTLEARSSWEFFEGISADTRLHRFAIIYTPAPNLNKPRPAWKQWVDNRTVELIGRPILLRYGVARSPSFTSAIDRSRDREKQTEALNDLLAGKMLALTNKTTALQASE